MSGLLFKIAAVILRVTQHSNPQTAAAVASDCQDDLGCELNGACIAGSCKCFPGWQGGTCGTLRLKPAPAIALSRTGQSYTLYPMQRPLPPHHERSGRTAIVGGDRTSELPDRQSTVTLSDEEEAASPVAITWGGSVITGDDGTEHLFVDTCCYQPSNIMHDLNGCQIVHATSTSLNKTFAFADVAVTSNRFNPHITRYIDGTYLLYNAGAEMNCSSTCTGTPPAPSPTGSLLATREAVPTPCSGTGINGLNVATSRSLSGPWVSHDHIQIAGYGNSSESNANPSPLVLPNGTIILAVRQTSAILTLHVRCTFTLPEGNRWPLLIAVMSALRCSFATRQTVSKLALPLRLIRWVRTRGWVQQAKTSSNIALKIRLSTKAGLATILLPTI